MDFLKALSGGLPLDPLPARKPRDDSVPHAPARNTHLTFEEEQLAVKNGLRYVPNRLHAELAPEFGEELRNYGHVYMYRFRPDFEMRAYPLHLYPAQCPEAAAVMLMITNNLDPQVAQFPHELVTYGGNGQVFSNWAQFWITMKYLSKMNASQTLVMMSGHPLGLFPSTSRGPRVVVTNGMVVPNYSTRTHYDRMFALGVTLYGQMTAGSYCYIGPQGIVHGTTLTLMNAGRKYLNLEDLSGKVYVSSGLGGMSGAQAKAAVISGCIGVVAEVDGAVLQKRFDQGWVKEVVRDLDALVIRIRDIFSLGFGPFRWVCTSGDPRDLRASDNIAASVLEDIVEEGVPPLVEDQYRDNIKWIKEADSHKLVVGSQARILYADHKGRHRIALAFNQAIKNGILQGAVVLSRDHHDVSGTDSPFRETANIGDGSAFCADMSVQNCIGDAFRGATWVALHNGGGVGWGEAVNGGFGLLLDGTEESEKKARLMLQWDVLNGVARRCWSGNSNAYLSITRAIREEPGLEVTLPHEVSDDALVEAALQ